MGKTVTDLVEWLTQVWDELQEIAENADGETFWLDDGEYTLKLLEAMPASAVLARIAADRKVMDLVFTYEAKIDGEWACCHSADQIRAGKCPETPVDEIRFLRAMASAYADRPGYRDEWAV